MPGRWEIDLLERTHTVTQNAAQVSAGRPAQLSAPSARPRARAADAASFADHLASATKQTPAQKAVQLHRLPSGPPAQTVAFAHKGQWYSEDAAGTITKLAAPPSGDVTVVKNRCGLFTDGKGGHAYRNTLGAVAKVVSYDSSQAGFLKTGDGSWAFRNAWGNVALKTASGGPITPPPGARIIQTG
jgi:hypothetical protein